MTLSPLLQLYNIKMDLPCLNTNSTLLIKTGILRWPCVFNKANKCVSVVEKLHKEQWRETERRQCWWTAGYQAVSWWRPVSGLRTVTAPSFLSQPSSCAGAQGRPGHQPGPAAASVTTSLASSQGRQPVLSVGCAMLQVAVHGNQIEKFH